MNPFLITKSEDAPLLRLDLVAEIGNAARDLFLNAAKEFEEGIEETITFDPGYQLGEGECFQIDNFEIDEELLSACRQPVSAERLDVADLPTLVIKSIVGYDFSNRQKRMFFQNFDSRRVLIPGKRFAVFATADTSSFRELEKPVILLDASLAAIWDNGTLKFKSFHLARQIFELTTYFSEATDEQIGSFVSHKLITCDDPNGLLKACSSWSRKKIALILRGGALDQMSAQTVKDAADAVGYEVSMVGNKIVLPLNKKELKTLLQFLDEDLYTGPISHRRLLSSGKRALA